MAYRVVVDLFNCLGCADCAKCVAACPAEVLTCNGGTPFPYNAKCIGCKACERVCDADAIKVES